MISHRFYQLAVASVVVFSLACTQIPLFNYLGFEFSALLAVFLSLVAGLLTISLWQRSRAQHDREIFSFTLHCSAVLGLLLTIPFAIITANSLFVKNCSFLHGTILFMLIPVPAAFLAHSIALVISVLVTKWRRALFVVIWFILLFHIIYVTFSGPQIFAFNPILGFFPGFTYDESLQITNRLLIYRAGTLAFAAALVLFSIAVSRRRHREASEVKKSPFTKPEVSLMVVLAGIVIGLYSFSNRLGLSSSEAFIERELGGRVETDHFVISYPDTLLKGRQLSHVIQLHEFYFARLAGALQVNPPMKIHSFLYSSSEQKGRLIGASGTNIAKPWLRQLHLNTSDVYSSLFHELAHVMAAEFGFPLLRIGTNAGLIEGFATAVDRGRYGEDLHRLAAMVFAIGLDPDLKSLFSFSGFIRVQPDVSYTLAGSFCQFLIDQYGLQRFKLLYRTGDFIGVYNKDISTLLQEWRRRIESYELREGELEKAAYLFKRPSIFTKECARVTANANAETRALLNQKRYREALASAERSLGHTTSIEAVTQKMNALFHLRRYSEAIAFAREKLQDSTVRHSLLTLRLVLGDALWAVDSVRAAKSSYEALLRSHLSVLWDEAAEIRLETIGDTSLAQSLKPYFTEELSDSAQERLLRRLAQTTPTNPLPRFLLARELASEERYAKAISEFGSISQMRSGFLEMMRQRRIAQSHFELGQYQKAQIHFRQSLNYATSNLQTLEIQERLKFCQWMEERTSNIGGNFSE